MTTKAIKLTEEQRHALGSLIAHTVGFECLDSLFEQLHKEFRPDNVYRPLKPWLDIKVMKRQYRSKDFEIGVLGKVYRDDIDSHEYDYALSNL
jgi:hypothetical protein